MKDDLKLSIEQAVTKFATDAISSTKKSKVSKDSDGKEDFGKRLDNLETKVNESSELLQTSIDTLQKSVKDLGETFVNLFEKQSKIKNSDMPKDKPNLDTDGDTDSDSSGDSDVSKNAKIDEDKIAKNVAAMVLEQITKGLSGSNKKSVFITKDGKLTDSIDDAGEELDIENMTDEQWESLDKTAQSKIKKNYYNQAIRTKR